MPCRAKVALDGMDTRDIDDFIIKEPRTLASIAQTNAVWRPRGPTHEATAKKTLQVNNHVETLRVVDEPRDVCFRKFPADETDRRQRVDDIAERAGLDDEDPHAGG